MISLWANWCYRYDDIIWECFCKHENAIGIDQMIICVSKKEHIITVGAHCQINEPYNKYSLLSMNWDEFKTRNLK